MGNCPPRFWQISYPYPNQIPQIVPPTVLLVNPALGSFLRPCLSRYENKERKLFVFFPLRRLLSSLPRQTNAFQKPVHTLGAYALCILMIGGFWSFNCSMCKPWASLNHCCSYWQFLMLPNEEKFYALGGYLDTLRLALSCHCKDGLIFWNIIF